MAGPRCDRQQKRGFHMSRVARRVATALTITAFVSVIGVTSVAAASKTTYEAVAGNFGTNSGAMALQARLTKAGWKGYRIEMEDSGRKGHYQVERSFSTRAAAQAEVTRLKAAKYHGAVEPDAGTI